jgi:N-acetylmuramic acid 6-phosphate etherase
MSTSKLLLGLDGGGSKTTALLANERQEILGRGTAGASNYQSIGLTAALIALDEAVTAAFRQAGVDESLPLSAVAVGMAGVDRPPDRAVFTDWAARRFGSTPVRIGNDAQIVLLAGVREGWGLAVISGTGSIVYAQDLFGRTARAGGWGYLLGDEGSGYAVGLAGLKAITRAWDGLAPSTALAERLLDHLRISSPAELIEYLYRRGTSRAEIAALARIVDICAREGDPAAGHIFDREAADLAAFALAAAKQLDLPPAVPCAAAGGLLINSSVLRDLFAQHAKQLGLILDPVTVVDEPARGAVKLAAALLAETG